MKTITEKSKIHEEIRKTRDYAIKTINVTFDNLIERLENPCSDELPKYETKLPLFANSSLFIGKKAVAVIFGDERVEVKTWSGVYKEIITRCYESSEHRKMLMYLRDKAHGKVRKFISASPAGMSRALKIDEELYCEIQYGTATLLHILVNQILIPVGFDYSDVSIILREGKR